MTTTSMNAPLLVEPDDLKPKEMELHMEKVSFKDEVIDHDVKNALKKRETSNPQGGSLVSEEEEEGNNTNDDEEEESPPPSIASEDHGARQLRRTLQQVSHQLTGLGVNAEADSLSADGTESYATSFEVNKDARKIFVGGLSKSVTNADLRKFFEEFGTVVGSVIKYDDVTGRPRGFGFVTFEDACVAKALCNYQEKCRNLSKPQLKLKGRTIEIADSEPMDLDDYTASVRSFKDGTGSIRSGRSRNSYREDSIRSRDEELARKMRPPRAGRSMGRSVSGASYASNRSNRSNPSYPSPRKMFHPKHFPAHLKNRGTGSARDEDMSSLASSVEFEYPREFQRSSSMNSLTEICSRTPGKRPDRSCRPGTNSSVYSASNSSVFTAYSENNSFVTASYSASSNHPSVVAVIEAPTIEGVGYDFPNVQVPIISHPSSRRPPRSGRRVS